MRRKQVAQHVQELHAQTQETIYSAPKYAQRYVSLLRRLGMKLRYRLPRHVKKSFCKHCYTPFAPGENCRVRTRKAMLVYTCFSCKKYTKTKMSP